MLPAALRLVPGVPPPAGIANTRPVALARICVGRPAADVPALMPRLYALCGPAHALAATLALEAAVRQQPVMASMARRRQLQADALREHLRRMWLDWPQQLAGVTPGATDLAALAALWQAGSADATAQACWVATHVLGMSPAAWLAQHDAERGDALAWWLAQPGAPHPARMLALCAALPLPSLGAWPAVEDALDEPGMLERLGRRVLEDDAFAAQPVLAPDALCPPGGEGRGEGAAHTGCWPRLRHFTGDDRPHTVLARLCAAVEEVARLAAGQDLLHAHAVPLGEGAAVAAVDMARGVLLHALRIDAAQRVAACHVVAPTEWNFHPAGAVAQALAQLDAGDPQAPRLARVLAAAFDPCLAVEVAADNMAARRTTAHEIHHA